MDENERSKNHSKHDPVENVLLERCGAITMLLFELRSAFGAHVIASLLCSFLKSKSSLLRCGPEESNQHIDDSFGHETYKEDQSCECDVLHKHHNERDKQHGKGYRSDDLKLGDFFENVKKFEATDDENANFKWNTTATLLYLHQIDFVFLY